MTPEEHLDWWLQDSLGRVKKYPGSPGSSGRYLVCKFLSIPENRKEILGNTNAYVRLDYKGAGEYQYVIHYPSKEKDPKNYAQDFSDMRWFRYDVLGEDRGDTHPCVCDIAEEICYELRCSNCSYKKSTRECIQMNEIHHKFDELCNLIDAFLEEHKKDWDNIYSKLPSGKTVTKKEMKEKAKDVLFMLNSISVWQRDIPLDRKMDFNYALSIKPINKSKGQWITENE